MNLRSFLKLVEIQTKVASVIPFFLGNFYSIYRFHKFDFRNFIFMFLSLFLFDMATTAINNYMDYKKAKKTQGYNYETHNAIVKYGLKESTVVSTILLLITLAAIFGVLLFLNTNIIILLLGAISFAIGIIYSFGPVPISRTPLGELLSGTFMGIIIPFIAVYIHVFDGNIVALAYSSGVLSINFNLIEVLYIFMISVPAAVGIANIMLANNICDMEDDIENRRYTLPIYIGKEKALKLFKILYYIAYIDLALLVALRIESLISLIVLITFIPVSKNIELFYEKQTKKDTFIVGVKNFVIINVVHVMAIAIATIF